MIKSESKHQDPIHICCDSSDDSNDGSVFRRQARAPQITLVRVPNVNRGAVGGGILSRLGFDVSRGGSSGGARGGSSGGGRGGSSDSGSGSSSPNVERGRVGGQDLDGGGGRGNRGGGGGGRGNGRGRGRASFQGSRPLIEPYRSCPGVFIARQNRNNLLLTKNLKPGFNVYGERNISVKTDGEKVEYRVWDPYSSNLAAAMIVGITKIQIPLGSRVLYLGASSGGTTVSHISDIVGPGGLVYVVEPSKRSGSELCDISVKRGNIVPILEDPRHPFKYQHLLERVDCIFVDVAQRDHLNVLGLNARLFLKNEGSLLFLSMPHL